MPLTFPGGKHIESHKSLSEDVQIVDLPLPNQIIIPLSQHTGSSCKPLVKKGDSVKVGTKIGEGAGLISSTVHASISGQVKEITDYNHPVLGLCQAVIIDSDGKDEKDSTFASSFEKNSELSKQELLTIIREAGIVGLGGAAFPTQVKLNPPNPVDTLLINGVECEPYLTCDYRLMLEKTQDVLKGILLIKKVINCAHVIIGIEDDKPEAISAMRNKIVEKSYPVQVVALKAKYPQGAEKQLIKAVLDREVSPGKLPFDVGVVVSNVGTAYSIFEAVHRGKPLYERIVTVTGTCIENPANLKVRIGTRFSELIEFCGKSQTAIGKIIMGGPMMGLTQFSDDVPVIKGTSGVLVLSEKETKSFESMPCIRCGRCVYICPVGMLPYALSLCVELENIDKALQYNPKDCIECGICTYVCPAKRRILESIRLVKALIQ